jgi:adenine-specific DNA-methyltransferase
MRIGDSLLPPSKSPSMKAVDGLTPVWPIDKEGNERCWRLKADSMRAVLAENRLVLGKYNKAQNTWTLNIWVRKNPTKKLKTVWTDKPYDAGTHGTTMLHNMLGRRGAFPFPKSVYAVRDCLAAVVRTRPSALILDFFAGSGTTLHATALLNAEDGGTRRCILVTNNEVDEKTCRRLNKAGVFRGDEKFEAHGIFEQATKPRCIAAITGLRPDGKALTGRYLDQSGKPWRAWADGFEENIEFFRLGYVDPEQVEIGAQFDAIHPLLWLAAGAHGPLPEPPASTTPIVVGPEKAYMVLRRESRLGELKRKLESSPKTSHVFLVTDSEESFAEMRSELPRQLVSSMLYRDYLRSFQINTERNL